MDAKLFGDVAGFLLRQLDATTREELQELIYAIDSSSISLTGHHFDRWTQAARSRSCAGVKPHVTLETAHAAPRADKGCCDYRWWAPIDATGARLATRLKANAGVRVEQTLSVGRWSSSSNGSSSILKSNAFSGTAKRRCAFS